MTLSASFAARLDVSTFVDGFVGGLAAPDGPLAQLTGITLPVSPGALDAASAPSHAVDAASITRSVTGLAGSVAPILAALPGPTQALSNLTGTLELVHQLSRGDLQARAQSFISSIEAELDRTGNGGMLAVLARIGELFGSGSGSGLGELLEQFLRFARVELPVEARSVSNFMPAVVAGAQVLAGLMGMESTLSEAERLSALMVTELDAEVLQARMAALAGWLSEADRRIAAFGASADDPAQLTLAREGLGATLRAALALEQGVISGMGFCEATLAYLDVNQTLAEVDTASNLLRAADLQAVEQSLAFAGQRLAPLLAVIDLSRVPEFSLDGLLSELERRVAGVASQIRALDVATFVGPLTEGLGSVTSALGQVATSFTGVIESIQAALDGVRQAITAIPFDQVFGAIRSFLDPVRQALEAITSLVAGLEELLGKAAEEVQKGLAAVEETVVGFKSTIDGVFSGIQRAVSTLDISGMVGEVSNGVRTVADAIRTAEMKPYFDTAAQAISSTADVIGAVPIGLLPDSMKDDLEAALAPIRAVDADAVKAQIESLLQITDGKFQLREEVVDAIHQIQLKYDDLIKVLTENTPRGYLVQIDGALDDAKKSISELVPQVALEPVEQAIARVKSAIADLDLRAQLAPLDHALDQVLEAVDRFSPATLLAEPERLLREARESVVALVRFAEWRPALENARAEALGLVDRFDPARLRPEFEKALAEARALLDRLPDPNPFGGIGQLLVAMLAGSGMRLQPASFSAVTHWLASASGTSALELRARNIATNLSMSHAAVRAVNLAAFVQSTQTQRSALSARISGLAAGDAKLQLSADLAALDLGVMLSPLVPNQARLRDALASAETAVQPLSVRGFSEVDVTLTRLHSGLAPLAVVRAFFAEFARRIGLPGLEQGWLVAVKGVIDTVTPARLVGLAVPMFEAVRDRVRALVDSVLAPVLAALDELTTIVDALNLGPLRASLESIYQAARQPIAAFKPSSLLAAELTAFDALKAEVLAFDPLGELRAVLDAVARSAARLIDLLKAEVLLEVPLAIYDEILAELSTLNVEGLATPLLDALDTVAAQVHQGLEETVDAFERLQSSLSDSGGPASLVASVSVSADLGF